MGDYKINGQTVSHSDWNSFKNSLVGELPSSKAIFADDMVTQDELVGVLDSDGNKKLTQADFKGIDGAQFGRLNDILKKHGFSAGAEAGRNVTSSNISAAPEYLLNDKDFILAAVKKEGFALRYAGPELKKDPEIVLAAVNQSGQALQYAGPLLKANKEIALAAVTQDGVAIEYVDSELKKDPEIYIVVVKKNGLALEYADPSIKKNPAVVLAAVEQCGFALQFADPTLKHNREIVLAAVKQDGRALEIVPAGDPLTKDWGLVLAAVKQNCRAVEYADTSLKFNTDFIYAAARVNLGVLESGDIHPALRARVWQKILDENNNFEGLDIPKAALASYGSFKNFIKYKYGPELIEQFRSLDNLLAALRTRTSAFALNLPLVPAGTPGDGRLENLRDTDAPQE